MSANVTIIGMGLIGTSIGMALKRSKSVSLKIVGHDREPTNSREAQKKGAIDAIEWNLPASVQDANMVIIATPISAMKDVMELASLRLRDDCVVTDTGSTKSQVLKWAEECLPRKVSFVGGHPMAGKEKSGPEAADGGLFQNAAYCVIPGASARPQAVHEVVAMTTLIGARPFFLDAKEHDSFVAAVSHLPLIVSSALVGATTRSPSWHEMARLAASGYRDVTRLASGDPLMNRDICVTNSPEVAQWVDRLVLELLEFRKLLGDTPNVDALGKYFLNVHGEREKWVDGVPLRPGVPDVDVPGPTAQMSSMIFGELMAQKARTLMKQSDTDDAKGKKKKR